MLGGSSDFRKREPLVLPGHHVPCRGNLHFGGVVATLHLLGFEDLEQFWMQNASVELENQLSDPGPDR